MAKICCSQSFNNNELVIQPESSMYQYKMYSYPFSQPNKDTLLKTIVSFLNKQGGYLFIGIQQTKNKKRIVRGLTLNESQKEDIHKFLRALEGVIRPNILFEDKILISYIPVMQHCYREQDYYLQGKYVIKITINPGDSKSLYSFQKKGRKNQYFIRQRDECVLVRKNLIDGLIKTRKSSKRKANRLHRCPQPHFGNPLYEVIQNNHVERRKVEKELIQIERIPISDQMIQVQPSSCVVNNLREKREEETGGLQCFCLILLFIVPVVYFYC